MENTYSISQVEVLSNIKSHTLRIWEKRYGIIEPKRTDTNIRYFTESDLKKILNISYLNNLGTKISKIAKLEDAEINSKVIEEYEYDKNSSAIIILLCKDIVDYDLCAFKSKLNKYLNHNSFEELIEDVIYPLFERIGVMWQANLIHPAQEHLFSNYIKELICAQTNLIHNKKSGDKVLLYLREGEYHELGLLIYKYILVQKGYDVYYLGQSVPFKDLKDAISNIQPIKVFTVFLAYLEEEEFKAYIKELTSESDIEFYLSGNLTFINEHNNNQYIVVDGIEQLNKIV